MKKNSYFYNGTIRKIVSIFGNLFSDIDIHKNDSNGTLIKSIKVPLSYSAKRHYIAKLKEESERTGTNVATILPRMSYEMTGLAFDPSRKKNNQRYQRYESTTTNKAYKLNSPVPYKLDFDLNIWTKNISSGLEIIEQILPYFNPVISITINDGDELIPLNKDINFTLNSVGIPVDYEGEVNSGPGRTVNWTLSFSSDIYLYPQLQEIGVIKQTVTNMITNDFEKVDKKLTYTINPPTANKDDVYVVDLLDEEF